MALRTYTPTQAVIAKSAGVFHWTAEGRKLYDFTSGVLVANLGHNPVEWHRKFLGYMGWLEIPSGPGYFESVPLTAYNAIAGIEADAVRRLVANLQSQARRQAARTGHVGRVRLRGDPESALGVARASIPRAT